jgi:hypothetical protein
MGYENQDTDLQNIVKLIQGFNRTWAVCGGWALDTFLGRVTRPHKDVDILIPRQEQLHIQDYLCEQGWLMKVAVDGNLSPWQKGDFLQPPLHCIWCSNETYQPNFFELLLNEMDNEYFYFRRETTIALPVEEILLQTEQGFPILAPEVVLLYKSKYDSTENDHDFNVIVRVLAPEKKGWLRDTLVKLYGQHKWVKYLELGDLPT